VLRQLQRDGKRGPLPTIGDDVILRGENAA
jgi:hypothetical protein